MKKNFLSIAISAMLLGVLFTSCKTEEPINAVDTFISQGVLYGKLDHAVTLDATVTYKLTGTFSVENGGTLTIPAGTRIEASEGYGSYIIVAQGGKIYVNGTAEMPVVMTAEDELAGKNGAETNSGYWGGLIINGKAKIAGATEGVTAKCEMNSKYIYGGTNDADDSGSITYLILKYAGARASADIEHNGLTLDAVGNGTTIHDLYIYKSADDGVECFGGTVDLTNVLVVNDDDDMFDNTQGYRGTWKNLYGIWTSGYSSTEADPRGIESDGNFDGLTPDDINQTDFIVENLTIAVNQDYNNATQPYYMQDAIKIRRGAKATITNALVKGIGAVQDLVDCTDGLGSAAAGTTINITNSLSTAVFGTESKPGTNNATINVASGNSGCDSSIFEWTGYTGAF